MTKTVYSPIFYTVKQLTYRVFLVTKETDDDVTEYYVRYDEKGWKCTCIANSMFGRQCKHIKMVKAYLAKGYSKFKVDKHLYLSPVE